MEEDIQIIISSHAREQMIERGTTEEEVIYAIQRGEREQAKKGRIMYRKNFQFNGQWRERQYKIKQVVPIIVEEENRLVVITVYVYYF